MLGWDKETLAVPACGWSSADAHRLCASHDQGVQMGLWPASMSQGVMLRLTDAKSLTMNLHAQCLFNL